MKRRIIWEKWENIEPPKEIEGEDSPIGFYTPLFYISQKLYAGNKSDSRFWVGNTTFDIDDVVAKTIDITEGVEFFNIFTRYKFRFSPGKNFKASEVKTNIEVNLLCNNKYELDESTIYKIRALKLDLEKEELNWLIFVLQNGKYEYIQEEDDNEFKQIYADYQNVKKMIGGYILSSGV